MPASYTRIVGQAIVSLGRSLPLGKAALVYTVYTRDTSFAPASESVGISLRLKENRTPVQLMWGAGCLWGGECERSIAWGWAGMSGGVGGAGAFEGETSGFAGVLGRKWRGGCGWHGGCNGGGQMVLNINVL